MRLRDLWVRLQNARFADFADVEIRGVTADSRRVEPGYLFAAIPGFERDGREFAVDALNRGASAILSPTKLMLSKKVPQGIVPDVRAALSAASAALNGDPSSHLQVVGVTGTNGKTTTCYLIRSIFRAAGHEVGLLGTIAYSIGDREIPATHTTPESSDLQAYLAEMVRLRIPVAVMEASSHALTQSRVADVHFAAGVFTNLSKEHFDYHKDSTTYRAAKGILFESLSEDAAAILNEDDDASAYFKERTRARVVGYGLRGRGEVRGEILSLDTRGMRFRIRSPWGEAEVRTSLIGRFNVSNALAAAATALARGVSLDAVSAGLERVAGVRGRLERVDDGQDFAVVVDYAHTDGALQAVLSDLRLIVQGRIITVFGCGGDRDKLKRPRMAAVVERFSDRVFVTSDNPRREKPDSIIKDVVAGFADGKRITVEADRGKAIRAAIEEAMPGDLVLIAGKGHETYQILGDTVVPFDDRLTAIDCIREKSGRAVPSSSPAACAERIGVH
ncbi:MAG: UDP-N-acetylmuramoyl-L-alanyl-D-glutamate--2,6-diaminopimelate ligase [Planctomycetes bacterium]|nr:UDP-N-acetylmuramoyl-L-alanyl-D-glutamate--2,6-diaminopimelate ligase [Planctomycetota bacterium]MBI3847014.1 UDP-N-acetylmuramoyl-L-alanyl-D-glutamate--2,6-diaminopimelate ligase [Planctomycetota bacterium]